MSDGLDILIVDDDASVCEVLADIVKRFYEWGELYTFTDVQRAVDFCLARQVGVGIFITDVYLGDISGFEFLNRIGKTFPTANEDAIVITGNASDEVVNQCIAAGVNHLLEKPIRTFALKLAVRAIVARYLNFARRLLQDPAFVEEVLKEKPS